METHLSKRYMATLSYRDVYRARRELEIMKSIGTKLRNRKYILRFTDKSRIYHLGHAKLT